MKIVALSWRDLAHPSAGGAERLVDRLLSELAGRGHEVALVCGAPVGPRAYPVVAAGGTYTQYLRAPFTCLRHFRDADVVIDTENGLPFFSPLWRHGPSVCLVHHVHTDQWGTRFPAPAARLARWAEGTVMPAVYRRRLFVAVSASTAKDLEHIGVEPARIRVVEPGVDLVASLPDKSTAPLFVALARLVPHKRVDLLLEAWRSVASRTGGRFVIIGSGPELAGLRRLAADIPGAELGGWLEEQDKVRLLGQAWCLVHGAHHEGWGMAIMEAGALGTPTLALAAPGVRDSVVDGTTGVVVDAPYDRTVDALADAWVALAADAPRRARLGAAARARTTHYGWDRMVDSWESVLEEAARPSKRRRRLRRPAAPVARGATAASRAPDDRPDGFRRMATLLHGFRTQFDDPDHFYALLAEDTIALIERYEPVAGRRMLDVGGGAGYFAEAFRRWSAQSVFIEPEWDEMTEAGRLLGFGAVGDGCRLPIADASFDIGFTSNVLEHVADPWQFLDELLRVVRPGGLVFVAFTNWLSPFGGHETSPWHYVGGERAARLYEERLGHPPKNRYGESLFRLGVGEVLNWARHCGGARLVDAFPRYYPRWSKPIVHVPGVRELITWNLTVVLRREE